MEEKINKVIKDRKDIRKISSLIRKVPFRDLKKTAHYQYSLIEKGTSENDLEKVYSQIEKIELILERERKINGKIFKNYDFHYNLSKNKRAVICISFHESKAILINGFFANTNFNQFKKSILKKFRKKWFVKVILLLGAI